MRPQRAASHLGKQQMWIFDQQSFQSQDISHKYRSFWLPLKWSSANWAHIPATWKLWALAKWSLYLPDGTRAPSSPQSPPVPVALPQSCFTHSFFIDTSFDELVFTEYLLCVGHWGYRYEQNRQKFPHFMEPPFQLKNRQKGKTDNELKKKKTGHLGGAVS